MYKKVNLFGILVEKYEFCHIEFIVIAINGEKHGMMKNNLRTIDIKKFKTLFPDYLDAEIGDDIFIADFKPDAEQPLLKFPFRLDGYVALFCFKGSLSVAVNLNTYQLEENTLIINIPGNIFSISGHIEGVHIFVVAMSKEFFSSATVDFNKLFNKSMALLENPCITLEEKEVDLLKHYMYIGTEIARMDMDNKNAIAGSLISSVAYLLASIWMSRLSSVNRNARVPSTRAQMVFNQFLQLVTEYHMHERGVAFYAERLLLTPKYLSKIIKSASGLSAPEWINRFVILEAKNMLKYSEVSIKEIVYKLNFPSQSVFYKFFKSHTGITPSEYRNS